MSAQHWREWGLNDGELMLLAELVEPRVDVAEPSLSSCATRFAGAGRPLLPGLGSALLGVGGAFSTATDDFGELTIGGGVAEATFWLLPADEPVGSLLLALVLVLAKHAETGMPASSQMQPLKCRMQ
mmetsp:Transcript_10249/g.27346  ORF Transcript_10249/g.27346 Transcript_10249/m.27346 type:complete len:127 (+) Transcript_10249:243-623(+)